MLIIILYCQGVFLFPPNENLTCHNFFQAIICGKVKDTPVQKILRNGKTVTIFSVGTGGLFDQRIVGSKDLPKPVQWHRIAVHNEILGSYAVKQLVKKYMHPLYKKTNCIIEKLKEFSSYCFDLTK